MTDASTTTTDIWKSAALILAGIVVSLVACIWNQSRDMVTKQDLVPIANSVRETQQQVNTLSDKVSEMRGEWTAQKKIGQ